MPQLNAWGLQILEYFVCHLDTHVNWVRVDSSRDLPPIRVWAQIVVPSDESTVVIIMFGHIVLNAMRINRRRELFPVPGEREREAPKLFGSECTPWLPPAFASTTSAISSRTWHYFSPTSGWIPTRPEADVDSRVETWAFCTAFTPPSWGAALQ
jgi:hypothetical protein